MKKVSTVCIFSLFFLLLTHSFAIAQQSINLLGAEYEHNLSPDKSDPDFYDFKAHATVPILYGKDYFFAALPSYNQTLLENLDFKLPSYTMRRIDVPFIYQHKISENQSIGGLFRPGIHSDFKDISGEDWVFSVAAFIKNSKHPRFHFRYGLYFSKSVKGMILIPAVTFYWRPTDRITVDASDPLSPEFSYKISQNFSTGAILRHRGGTYKLTKDFQSRYLTDGRYELAPYLDFKICNIFILRGTAGYAFSRKIKLYENKKPSSNWYDLLKKKNPIHEAGYHGLFFNIGLRLAINRNR